MVRILAATYPVNYYSNVKCDGKRKRMGEFADEGGLRDQVMAATSSHTALAVTNFVSR